MRALVGSAIKLAIVLGALLWLTAHVGQAATRSPGDICPPRTSSAEPWLCYPCTPERCAGPGSSSSSPCVIVRVTRGVDYLEATGRLTFRQTGKGYDYAELDGRPGVGGTGRVKVNTIAPPLELEQAPGRCRS